MQHLYEIEQVAQKILELGESNWHDYEYNLPSQQDPYDEYVGDPFPQQGYHLIGNYICGCGNHHEILNYPVTRNTKREPTLDGYFHVLYGIWINEKAFLKRVVDSEDHFLIQSIGRKV